MRDDDETSRAAEQRSPRWIDRTADLPPVVTAIGPGPLAVDCEADSFHHYREKICLIQLSFGDADVLVDPLSGVDLGPLGEVLGRERVRKILHGSDYDIRMLRRDHGFVVRGLFDTMIAARLVGERAFGLSGLLEKHVGVRLDKSKRLQRADWSVRPLPAVLVRYAAADTRFLGELAARLAERLSQLGRTEWAEEEFRRLEQTRWEAQPRDDASAWARVKGLRALDRRGLAVLRELAALREATARRHDVPPFRVARDEALLDLAARQAIPDFSRVPGLPRSWRTPEGARELRGAIEHALALDERAWPVHVELPPRPRLSPEREARLRRLCRGRDQIAARLGIDPTVLASRGSIERLLAAFEEGRPLAELPDLRAWQRDLLAPVLGTL